MKVLLRKRKENEAIEFAPIYFNSTTKTVINSKYMLDKSFQEILYRINSWVNEGSGWVIESTDVINIKNDNKKMLSLRSYTKEDKSMFNDLDYKGIEFTVPKKRF